jgi:phage major head subunit gpT-like protein
MTIEFQLLSGDAQRAIEVFSEDFALALTQGDTEEWAKNLGRYESSNALKTTFPIPTSAAGYKEFKGDVTYRSLFEKSISLLSKTWQDGVAELASTVEAPDFTGWGAEPAAMAAAQKSLLNEIVMAALEANATHPYDAVAFFSGSHPYNVFKAGLGTFDNDHTGDLTSANAKVAMTNFRGIRGANGKHLGLRMTHVVVPPALEQQARDVFENQIVIVDGGTVNTFGAVDNRLRNRVQIIVSDEATSDVYWYPLALNKPGMYPWVVQDQGAPEEIRSDKTSAMYQQTLKIGVAYVQRANGGLALPHCIQRWDAT